ncbi:asparagine synthase-related protein [Luteimicrobium xylanilyticum]
MAGVAVGRGARRVASRGEIGTPRAVLERLLDRATEGRRTYVMFSGGRDSSSLLALATSCARRRGDDDPMPVTLRHPGVLEADETAWQELVIDHLGLRDHLVIEVRGEQELLGEPARRAMGRRGAVWPSALQLRDVAYRQLDDGVVVTGEGGDHVLTAHRITMLRNVLHDRRVPSWHELRLAAATFEPRRRYVRRVGSLASRHWLRGAAQSAYSQAVGELARSPLSWARATLRTFDPRVQSVILHNHEEGIREYGLEPLTPFAHPEFHAALARSGGFWGYEGRTHVFRMLFGDLLPDAILARQTKASFNGARWGELEKEFARSWTGDCFDPEWVDAEALRREWLSDRPGPGSDYLIQLAWAASEGITTPLADGTTFP